MNYGGAQGKTADEMAKVLHFTLPQERLHPAFGGLTGDLLKDDKDRPYELHVANRLWGQKGLSFLPEFVQLTEKNYRAGLKEVDFARDQEEARKTVNRWVEEQTRDKIKDVLLPGDLTPRTRLVLTNAIYYKATWKTPFPKDQTKDAPFEVADGEKVTVPMMHHTDGLFKHFEGEGFQWLELPYKGDRLSMIVLLPQQRGQLAGLEKALTQEAIQKGVEKLQVHLVQVGLPRFKATFRLDLLDDLIKMGMRPGPLSGIVSGESLYISHVFHKAYIDVDEMGTVAAAATAVVDVGVSDRKAFSFRADHPFLFLIRDRQTGNILFLGRVADPRP